MLDSLNTLLQDQVKDIYNAENQLLKALARMSKKSSNSSLRAAFDEHRQETVAHIDRLVEIAAHLEIKPGGKTCKAMQGLIEEGKEALEQEGDPNVVDAALIGAAMRAEHYEIAAYSSALAIAERLDSTKVAKLLSQTLEDELAAADKLATISEAEIMPAAPSHGSTDDARVP